MTWITEPPPPGENLKNHDTSFVAGKLAGRHIVADRQYGGISNGWNERGGGPGLAF